MGSKSSAYSIEQVSDSGKAAGVYYSLMGPVQDVTPYCHVMVADTHPMPWTPPNNPTCIYDFLFLGDGTTARNVGALKRLGVTCVINTAESYIETGRAFYKKSGISYLGIDAEDEPDYNIMQHFDEVYDVIERERKAGGKVFIHCIAGVNRSGALTVAYCMVHEHWGPIKASRFVRSRRGRLLTNTEFQKQLISFGNEKDLLILDKQLINLSKDE